MAIRAKGIFSIVACCANNGDRQKENFWLGRQQSALEVYLAANRAWLPHSIVTDNMNESLSTSTRAIRFEIAPTSGISLVHYNTQQHDGIYTIDGKRVNSMTQRGVYVIRKNGRSELRMKN